MHKTTGKSPSELLFGFNINSTSENVLSDANEATKTFQPDNLVQVRNEAAKRIVEQQNKDKIRFDSKHLPRKKYSSGDLVSIQREVRFHFISFLASKYQCPYRILKVLPNDRYLVEDTPLTRKRGQRRHENVIALDKIKPWLASGLHGG